MFHALALATSIYTAQSGDTLSGIAANNGVSLSQLEAANPQISDPNLIYVGESINLSGGSASAPAESSPSPSSVSTDTSGDSSAIISGDSSGSSQSAPSGGSSGGSLSDVPGVPSSFAQCVAFRESTNGTNQGADGGVYGIISASGDGTYAGEPLSQQKAAFTHIYETVGASAWAADGCPGT
jgi:hypothetical protein